MKDIRINLGCGTHAPKHWINFDSSLRVWVDKMPLLQLARYKRRFPSWVKRRDLTKRLPFSDGSVHLIYSSHFIEHITHSQAESLLRECKRILIPGGRIRIMTPNLRFSVENYIARRESTLLKRDAADYFMRWLGVFEDEVEVSRFVQLIRNIQRKNLHQWLYDENSLRALMEKCGFQNIETKDNWVSDFPDLEELEPPDLRVGSVCAEASIV